MVVQLVLAFLRGHMVLLVHMDLLVPSFPYHLEIRVFLLVPLVPLDPLVLASSLVRQQQHHLHNHHQELLEDKVLVLASSFVEVLQVHKQRPLMVHKA